MALVHRQAGGKIEDLITKIGVHVVTVPAERGASSLRAYRLNREVRHVEFDSLAQAVDLPNDPYFDEQWGMTKVQAPQAWSLTQGNGGMGVAGGAYYANSIAVGGTDSGDNLKSWSNHGDWVDVAAPGSAYSTLPDALYGYKAGTSMGFSLCSRPGRSGLFCSHGYQWQRHAQR